MTKAEQQLKSIRQGPWRPLYLFVVGYCVKWDKKESKVSYVVQDPAYAYEIYEACIKQDKGTEKEYLYDWFLHDSFHIDALEFCKKKSEERGSKNVQ